MALEYREAVVDYENKIIHMQYKRGQVILIEEQMRQETVSEEEYTEALLEWATSAMTLALHVKNAVDALISRRE